MNLDPLSLGNWIALCLIFFCLSKIKTENFQDNKLFFLMESFSFSCRLFWASGDEIRAYPRLSDHCLQHFQNSQYGHVHLGTKESSAGQAGQSECLDFRPQWPVTMVTGNIFKNCFTTHRTSSLKRFPPGWCGPVNWVLAREPKVHQLYSQSGHMHGLRARWPVGGAWEASTHWCFSPSLAPSLP